MAFRFTLPYRKQIPSRLSLTDTANYLKDYETAIAENFPGVESFTEKSHLTYAWRFEKISHSGKELQIAFATRFEESPDRIKIVPAGNSEQASLSGTWEIKPGPKGCTIEFSCELSVEIPLPGLLKGVIAPMAEKELTKLFDTYAHNVQKALG